MTLRLHNTLTADKQPFAPLQPGRVGMYTCGPTVYGHIHIGNFRAFLFYDLVSRHLRFLGHHVVHVMNVTDVDDKIIHRAWHAGVGLREQAAPFEAAFLADLAALRAHPAEHYPRATEHVPDMIDLIQRLLESGHAYESGGDVYFRISSFPAYGRLGRLDRDGLRAGARVAQDDYDKESATDFALWKSADEEALATGAVWDAPFGRGRPGWHIECSAMSRRYLGDSFDIHCGGIDLVFPHHENEIAQSEAASGHPMAAFWLHNGHLVDATGEKMARRLGNISTLRELLDAGHDPLAIRMFLMANAHYRSQLRMDEDSIHAAGEQVRRLRAFADRVRALPNADGNGSHAPTSPLAERVSAARAAYREALDDDLNLPQGLGHVFDLAREANAALDRGEVDEGARQALLGLLVDIDAHLDVLTPAEGQLEAEIERLIAEREEARRSRDYARADAIRSGLAEQGIQLEDTAGGVQWRRIRR